MKRNPFIGLSLGAWSVFIPVSLVSEFKPWAWMLWVPWLTFATLMPVVWWVRNRSGSNDKALAQPGRN